MCVAHLYLQLLNHLHLDSALSSAAVIKGVLIVQVPGRKGRVKRISIQSFLSDKLISTNKKCEDQRAACPVALRSIPFMMK